MSKAKFAIPATDDAISYLDAVADSMSVLYGISHSEAVGIINAAFGRAQALADKSKAEAAAGEDTPGVAAVNRINELGGTIGINLESESGVRAFTNRAPEFWARVFFSNKE